MSYEPKEQHSAPAAHPVPEDTPQPQVYQYVQPQQPTLVYTVPSTVTPIPVTGSGRGLTGKLPQLATCCMCFPLQTGAMIIAFLMTIYYAYCGIPLLLAAPTLIAHGSALFSAIAIVFGVLYVGIATLSIFGFVGILRERLDWVSRFVRWYFIGSCIWLALEILGAILTAVGSSSYSDAFSHGSVAAWVLWFVILMVALAFQYYFWCALVSYERVLKQKNQSFDGTVPADGAHAAKDVSMA
ncbi:hypothetical protein BGZ81_001577 [Podila clonocystis]|nr:hypothetical protein BGZ81_001577 [Podila clonocystis]